MILPTEALDSAMDYPNTTLILVHSKWIPALTSAIVCTQCLVSCSHPPIFPLSSLRAFQSNPCMFALPFASYSSYSYSSSPRHSTKRLLPP